MESDTLLFDPEFEAILRDVAADPRSSLLRVKRPHKLGELFDAYSPISAHATGLTSAERHLVQVHRNEVAWLLRQACLIKLIEGPTSRQFVSRYVAPNKEVRLLAPTEMERRVREQRECSSGRDECAHGLDLLLQCVATSHDETPRVSELAIAACRLEPSDQARLMVGYDLVLQDQARGSLGLMQRLLTGAPREREAAKAWGCVGMCFVNLGDLPSAHEALLNGSSQATPETANVLSRLVLGLQLGLRQDVLDCAVRLDESVQADDPVVLSFVHVLRLRRRALGWAPTNDGTRMALSMHDRLGHTARRIADVLV